MKQVLIIFLLIISFFCAGQKFKKSEFQDLYNKTITAIKNNDTIGFVNLWECPDSISCLYVNEPHIVNFRVRDLKQNFAEASANWLPYLNRMKYYTVDLDKDDKKSIEQWGQHFCYVITLDNDKKKLIYICAGAKYFEGRLSYRYGSWLPIICEK
ncbi:MAG: hypothetical protein ABIP51_08435 [Bacteroidia bacterium]